MLHGVKEIQNFKILCLKQSEEDGKILKQKLAKNEQVEAGLQRRIENAKKHYLLLMSFA